MKKVAVCMYGQLRTYNITSKSLIRHVLEVNNADLFFYGPEEVGVSIVEPDKDPTQAKFGNLKLLEERDRDGGRVQKKDLEKVYGAYLKEAVLNNKAAYECHNLDCDTYSIVPVERVYSMLKNMEGAVRLAMDYSRTKGIVYDCFLLIRPDLAFYSDICIDKIDTDESFIHIPQGGGNLKNGNEQYYCAYYKNVERGELIEAYKQPFTDQFILGTRKAFESLKGISSRLKYYSEIGLPIHPETIMFYNLAFGSRKVILHKEWKYEIFRNNYATVENEFLRMLPAKGRDIATVLCKYDENAVFLPQKKIKTRIKSRNLKQRIKNKIQYYLYKYVPSYRIGLLNRQRFENHWYNEERILNSLEAKIEKIQDAVENNK